jgi:hypothetical protein
VGEDERWKLGTKKSRNHLVYVMTVTILVRNLLKFNIPIILLMMMLLCVEDEGREKNMNIVFVFNLFF